MDFYDILCSSFVDEKMCSLSLFSVIIEYMRVWTKQKLFDLVWIEWNTQHDLNLFEGSSQFCSVWSSRLSSDVPPETPSTSGAAAGQPEASQTSRAQDSSQAEASAEANTSTASAGTDPPVLSLFVLVEVLVGQVYFSVKLQLTESLMDL